MATQYLTSEPGETLDRTVEKLSPDKVLVITDKNVEEKVFPLLGTSKILKDSCRFILEGGEDCKNLDNVVRIWSKLEEVGATRNSLITNIGGGVVTDLGGFAASTFKRGIRTINIPTTLLGAVDAATGGKTGINFQGLKNEIGTFHHPSAVILSEKPFRTLPTEEILSGYAEMVKTALISDRSFYNSLLEMDMVLDHPEILGKAVEKCVKIKEEIVADDPNERGLRKILNFGHTAGHAFESLALEKGRTLTHGKAVAHGILVALILSHASLGFPSQEVAVYQQFLKRYYGLPLMSCEDMDEVIEKMRHDKKNKRYGEPVFTLLKDIGAPEININLTDTDIRSALELYIDMA